MVKTKKEHEEQAEPRASSLNIVSDWKFFQNVTPSLKEHPSLTEKICASVALLNVRNMRPE